MQDLYLRFPDEAAAKAVLYRIEGAQPGDPENNVPAVEGYEMRNYTNIDTLGVLYEKAPDPLPEGYEPVPISGWHVNVRLMPGEDVAALEPFKIEPRNPRRVWG